MKRDYIPSNFCQHGTRWGLSCSACDEVQILVLQVKAAHCLLDRCREGAEEKASPLEIARALRLVGEIEPRRYSGAAS